LLQSKLQIASRKNSDLAEPKKWFGQDAANLVPGGVVGRCKELQHGSDSGVDSRVDFWVDPDVNLFPLLEHDSRLTGVIPAWEA
jgi:hypothetical protein